MDGTVLFGWLEAMDLLLCWRRQWRRWRWSAVCAALRFLCVDSFSVRHWLLLIYFYYFAGETVCATNWLPFPKNSMQLNTAFHYLSSRIEWMSFCESLSNCSYEPYLWNRKRPLDPRKHHCFASDEIIIMIMLMKSVAYDSRRKERIKRQARSWEKSQSPNRQPFGCVDILFSISIHCFAHMRIIISNYSILSIKSWYDNYRPFIYYYVKYKYTRGDTSRWLWRAAHTMRIGGKTKRTRGKWMRAVRDHRQQAKCSTIDFVCARNVHEIIYH